MRRTEIEVCFAPNTGHSIADTTQNRQPHHAGSDERAVKTRVEGSPSIGGYSGPSEGRDARPGEGVSREWASVDTTTPAAFAAISHCSGVKSGSNRIEIMEN